MLETITVILLLSNTLMLGVLVNAIKQNNNKYISNKIEEVTQSLNTISDKSNILSLNATIEASKIGKQGSGFIKIIEEMKSLAEEANHVSNRISKIK